MPMLNNWLTTLPSDRLCCTKKTLSTSCTKFVGGKLLSVLSLYFATAYPNSLSESFRILSESCSVLSESHRVLQQSRPYWERLLFKRIPLNPASQLYFSKPHTKKSPPHRSRDFCSIAINPQSAIRNPYILTSPNLHIPKSSHPQIFTSPNFQIISFSNFQIPHYRIITLAH